MRVSAAMLTRYRQLLDALGAQAADRVSASIAYTSGTRVAPVRDAAIEALADAAAVEGDMAQALAAQLFDEVCELEGIDVTPGQLFEGVIDEGWIERKVHWHARSLIEGNRSKFEGECRRLADYYVKRCAYENTIRNCDANHVRYARIPSGTETCPWCLMLASRGFVYHSEASAEHGKHVGCDCIVLPGIPGRTKVDGYDEEGMRDRWAMCQETAGVRDGDTYRERKRILREAATRDPHWLLTGEVPEIRYLKPRDSLLDHEKRTIDALQANGFNIVVNLEDGSASANIDLTIGRPGSLWEMKNVGNGKHAVEDRMRDSFHKWTRLGLDESQARTVLSSFGATRDEELIVREMRQRMYYAKEALYVSRDGSVLRI